MAIDLMLSVIPIVLIIFLLLQEISFLSTSSASKSHMERTLANLESIADYVVKSGAAVHVDGVRYPNWIDEKNLSGLAGDLRERTGISELYIGTNYPSTDYENCIYRFVVSGPEKEIKQLFVCGG
jgi:hypothetical protein